MGNSAQGGGRVTMQYKYVQYVSEYLGWELMKYKLLTKTMQEIRQLLVINTVVDYLSDCKNYNTKQFNLKVQ